MPWIRKQLRGKKVWARCDMTGKLQTDENHKIDIIYQPQGKIYQASLLNITADDELLILDDEQASPSSRADLLAQKKSKLRAQEKEDEFASVPKEAIRVFTDGACSGNPGPMGIGVVVMDPISQERQELSEYLGLGTNNIAELTAIQRGLSLVPSSRQAVVFSDSAYALGVLFKHWKAKANLELITNIRAQIQAHRQVLFVKVLGHSGIAENERCDELARDAIVKSVPSLKNEKKY